MTHGLDEGRYSGAFEQKQRIEISDRPPSCLEFCPHFGKKFETGAIAISRIAVRKMLSDISEAGGAEQRITNGMAKDVGIRMALQSFFKWEFHAAEDQFTPGCQAMVVDALSDADCGPRARRSSAGKKDLGEVKIQRSSDFNVVRGSGNHHDTMTGPSHHRGLVGALVTRLGRAFE